MSTMAHLFHLYLLDLDSEFYLLEVPVWPVRAYPPVQWPHLILRSVIIQIPTCLRKAHRCHVHLPVVQSLLSLDRSI
jgi:hypothetical protein